MSRPDIAGAVSAATRRRLIAEMESQDPALYQRYMAAQARAERALTHVRTSGEFPLTARGDINTYMLFAELARKIVAPRGRVGLLVPSGIATDATTRVFFAELIESQSLVRFYDFENKAGLFPDVHRSFKFSTLVFAGQHTNVETADFSFFLRRISELKDRNRHIALSRRDFALLNPNTLTCPIFRDRRDAELTKTIYRRVPILIDEHRQEGGNPWEIRFLTLFHQTNDAELFRDPARLKDEGFRRNRDRWLKGHRVFVPLYEAKMLQAYDHRAAGVVVARGNWVRQGQTEPTTLVDHQNPEFTVEPRWWVDQDEVAARLGDYADRPAYLSFKDVTSPTNQRTMIAALVTQVGMLNSAPLMLTGPEISARLMCCLLANVNSFAYDFVARQKVGGVHLNFFIVKQLPTFPPDKYDERCPWSSRMRLEKWISDRVLKLTCTANDMRPLAEAAGLDPPIHKWNAHERAKLLAELDAAYFILYGLPREDVEYILGTFQGLRRRERAAPELFESNDLILSAYDELLARSTD